jgi:hypothetical protein
MLGAQGLWTGMDLYRATPIATWDLGLYGLMRKTVTYVPQLDSNPLCKDHQIITPDALDTTADFVFYYLYRTLAISKGSCENFVFSKSS